MPRTSFDVGLPPFLVQSLLAAAASTNQTSAPCSGRTPCAGSRATSVGPRSTSYSADALSAPATRKITFAAALNNLYVQVRRVGGGLGELRTATASAPLGATTSGWPG